MTDNQQMRTAALEHAIQNYRALCAIFMQASTEHKLPVRFYQAAHAGLKGEDLSHVIEGLLPTHHGEKIEPDIISMGMK